jgi:hypothetical protein
LMVIVALRIFLSSEMVLDVDLRPPTPKFILPHDPSHHPPDFHSTRHRRLHWMRIISLGVADEPQVEQGNTWDIHV